MRRKPREDSFPMKPDRREIAHTIVDDPSFYKVCMVCGCVTDKESPLCPNCFAYRFNEDPQAVEDQALTLAANPEKVISRFDLEPDP